MQVRIVFYLSGLFLLHSSFVIRENNTLALLAKNSHLTATFRMSLFLKAIWGAFIACTFGGRFYIGCELAVLQRSPAASSQLAFCLSPAVPLQQDSCGQGFGELGVLDLGVLVCFSFLGQFVFSHTGFLMCDHFCWGAAAAVTQGRKVPHFWPLFWLLSH